MPDVDPGNEGQACFWSGPGSAVWVAGADRYDAQLEPFLAPVISGADVEAGHLVLDVGCGTGALSRAVADVVGDDRVVGCDISEAMVDEARRRSGARTRHLVADAQIARFESEEHDAVVSRYGVMFFGDPEAAFANLARTARPGGRLSFVCWQDVSDNEWMRAPGEAVAPILGPPPVTDPAAPGPFSFADPGRIEAVVSAGGWTGIEIEALTPDLHIGGACSLDDAVDFMMGRTAIAALLVERSPEDAEAVRQLLRDNFAAHHDGVGVRFSSASWVVRARRR